MTQRVSLLAWCCSFFALFSGCRKEVPDTAPPLSVYRSYDRVAVEVRADPAGGQVLLCKSTPIERSTAFLQLMGAAGDLRQRIFFDQFPGTVENIAFQEDDRWYTDFLPHPDGSFYIIGLARQTQMAERIHLVVHHIDRNGGQIEAPFRRYIVDNGILEPNIDGAEQSINGLPRSRALGALVNDGLVVAVRWETQDSAGIRLYRFPLGNTLQTTLQADLGLAGPSHRMHALACDPATGETVLVFEDEANGNDHRVVVQKSTPGNTTWTTEWSVQLDGPDFMLNAEPQQLQWRNGTYLLIGNQPRASDMNVIKPFVTHFTDEAEVNGNLKVLDGLAAADQPVAAYCANWWNGSVTLVTQVHEASALQPFFDGDITSDLVLTDLAWPGLEPVGSLTVIPGQGLRGIGLFVTGGERLIMGSQHAYLNTAVVHTFRAVVE